MILAALIMGTFVTLEGENIVKSMGLIEEETILVFVIPVPENAARIRSVVSPDRVIWEGEAGFALVGDRVITSSLDSAGEVIKGAGWIDRPIQIVTLAANPDEEREGGTADPASREARRERLLGLVSKPTLSRGEQVFVLAAMNGGIEI